MGFFDFLKKKSTGGVEKSSSCDDVILPSELSELCNAYEIIMDCAGKLDNFSGSNLDVFFQEYDRLIDAFKRFLPYSQKLTIAGDSLTDRFSRIRAEQDIHGQTILYNMTTRAKAKAMKLKTVKGQQNNIRRFFDSTSTYEDRMPSGMQRYFCQLREFPLTEQLPSPEETPEKLETICSFIPVTFTNGYLTDLALRDPNRTLDDQRGVAYFARYIISDGRLIDLNNTSDILQIEVPNYRAATGDLFTVFELSYILRMRAIQETNPQVASVFIPKVAQLMKKSPLGWDFSYYRRLAEQLWAVGDIAGGDEIVRKYKCSFQTAALEYQKQAVTRLKEALRDCRRDYDTDLIQMTNNSCCCPDCTKYQGRIYSISGKTKAYPKLPDIYLHPDAQRLCNNSNFFPFKDWMSVYVSVVDPDTGDVRQEEVDPIEYSNRPYSDGTSEEERVHYNEVLKKQAREEQIFKLKREYYIAKAQDPDSVSGTVWQYIRARIG